MANTYSQIYLHIIFSVRERQRLLKKPLRTELCKYISKIIENKGHKLIIINGIEDHLHLVISFKPDFKLSELIKSIKTSSSKWINEQNKIPGKFQWQEGYAVFS